MESQNQWRIQWLCQAWPQISIFKKTNQVRFTNFLKSHYSRALKMQFCLENLSDFKNQTLESQIDSDKFHAKQLYQAYNNKVVFTPPVAGGLLRAALITVIPRFTWHLVPTKKAT